MLTYKCTVVALTLLLNINIVPVYSFLNGSATKATTYIRSRTDPQIDPAAGFPLKKCYENNEESSTIDRRRFITGYVPKLLVSSAFLIESFRSSFQPSVVNAAFGDSSNIELPSYVDFLIERNQQVDTTKVLYQGADQEVQLQRILSAISKIKTIPDIAERKKWSQVQGVITGPLGTLIATMNQVGGTNKEAQQLTAKVKSDLFTIGQCATTKNERACIAATITTLNDLNDFVKVAF
jgi:hypothetical protein